MGIFKFFRKLRNNIKRTKLDKKMRAEFIKSIKEEQDNSYSLFNQYKLGFSDDQTTISCLITIPETIQLSNNSQLIKSRLIQEVRGIRDYLLQQLNWGEYLSPVKFDYLDDKRVNASNAIDDEDTIIEDDNFEVENLSFNNIEMVSCTYLARWIYQDTAFGGKKSFWDRVKYMTLPPETINDETL